MKSLSWASRPFYYGMIAYVPVRVKEATRLGVSRPWSNGEIGRLTIPDMPFG